MILTGLGHVGWRSPSTSESDERPRGLGFLLHGDGGGRGAPVGTDCL